MTRKDMAARILANWGAIAALVAALGVGFTAAGRLAALDRRMATLESNYSRIICLLGMPEDVRIQVASNLFSLDRECPR